MKKIALTIALVSLMALPLMAQDHGVPAAELSSEIPALSNFHEVIYPLWHEAWPNKNFDLIRDLLPEVRKHVEAVDAVILPGILRDKKQKWDEGVKKLDTAASRLEKAVAENDEKAMLDAVEDLHARYESLVRIVRPLMKELESYHVTLYEVYHYYMPGKELEKLREASRILLQKCETLLGAKTPRRLEKKETEFRHALQELSEKTKDFSAAVLGTDMDKISRAVEEMHTKYQAVEKLFD
ncbi:MAG: hypothetical protein QHI48_03995 [Bacteroidota bacterium]|nr:hypothetical protein [Bacteroidota bacterium]